MEAVILRRLLFRTEAEIKDIWPRLLQAVNEPGPILLQSSRSKCIYRPVFQLLYKFHSLSLRPQGEKEDHQCRVCQTEVRCRARNTSGCKAVMRLNVTSKEAYDILIEGYLKDRMNMRIQIYRRVWLEY